jgi:hypothetical protein
MRIVAAGAIVIATTFGGLDARSSAGILASSERPAERTDVAADAVEVVLSFGDVLAELHDVLGYEESYRDLARVESICQDVVSSYPRLADAVGERGTALLVAAESMVDACRRGFAATLDNGAFEIVNGDYYTYLELSSDFTN